MKNMVITVVIKDDPDHWDPVRIKLNQQKAELKRYIQRAYAKAAAMAAAAVPAETLPRKMKIGKKTVKFW